MSTNTRVQGHTLVWEGAPHDADGRRIRRGNWGDGKSGTGRAKCSCGALSDELPSKGARQRWHREHKESLTESNLITHARRELELIGEEPETIAWYLRVVKEFASFGHSGGSASVAIPTLNRLLSYKALSPLTDDPEDWILVGPDMWQNRRQSDCFSSDGGRTYTQLDTAGVFTSARSAA